MKFIITLLTINLVFGFSSSLSDSSKFTTNEIRFYSDVIIDSSEIITKNIRILGGGLTVYGTVESQITVMVVMFIFFHPQSLMVKLLLLAAMFKPTKMHR